MAKLLSPDLDGLADTGERMMSKALEGCAQEAKRSFQRAASKAGGGDAVLSGVGRKGRKISARYDFQKGSRGLGLKVKALGPWQFVEGSRRGGYKIPKRPKRKGKPRRLHIEGDWATAGSIRGGGYSARHHWTRTADDFIDEASDIYVREFLKRMRW